MNHLIACLEATHWTNSVVCEVTSTNPSSTGCSFQMAIDQLWVNQFAEIQWTLVIADTGRTCSLESVIARVRNSGSHFQSNFYSFCRVKGWILFVIAGVRNNWGVRRARVDCMTISRVSLACVRAVFLNTKRIKNNTCTTYERPRRLLLRPFLLVECFKQMKKGVSEKMVWTTWGCIPK